MRLRANVRTETGPSRHTHTHTPRHTYLAPPTIPVKMNQAEKNRLNQMRREELYRERYSERFESKTEGDAGGQSALTLTLTPDAALHDVDGGNYSDFRRKRAAKAPESVPASAQPPTSPSVPSAVPSKCSDR